MKVRGLVRDPAQEQAEFRMRLQSAPIISHLRKLPIGKERMNGAVANRMYRNGIPAATASRNRMMPFDPTPQRSMAKPADIV